MTITIATFPWVPDVAHGQVRDLRPRWALEEAGLPYEVHLVTPETKDSSYRGWQPFGQVPAYRDDTVEMFESGAMLLHIADQSDALAPRDAQERAQTQAWVLAAMNSVEPQVMNVILPGVFFPGEDWVAGWRPHAEALAAARLRSLAAWLDGKEWLVGDRFGVADILMATVLRGLAGKPLLTAHPVLVAYLERCLARPAFGRALQAQLDLFQSNAPAEAEVAQG